MLKDVLQEKIVNPVVRSGGVIISIGKIKKADERNNLCDIFYVDKDGKPSNKDNVAIRLTGNDTWFPSKGDLVAIEDRGSAVCVIGPAIKDYAAEEREKHKPTKDVHPDSSGSIGGCIF